MQSTSEYPPPRARALLWDIRPDREGSRAPRSRDLEALEGRGGTGKEAGASICTVLIRLLCCGCGEAKLAPIHSMLDEEAEELVEQLQGVNDDNKERKEGRGAFWWSKEKMGIHTHTHTQTLHTLYV